MKQFLLLLSTVLTVNTFGQSPKAKNNITIGYSFSPDYSYRTLKNDDNSSAADLIIKNRDNMEKAKPGYTTGLKVAFHFSSLFAVETGVQYSNKGYKTAELPLTYQIPDASLPNKVATTYCYQYIGIPLLAKFTFGKNKVRFLSSAGVVTNFLINAKLTNHLKYDDGSTNKQSQSCVSGFNKFDLSPMVSIGVDYQLTEKIHLSAEPTFRFGLIETKDAPISEKLWNAGLALGISYELK